MGTHTERWGVEREDKQTDTQMTDRDMDGYMDEDGHRETDTQIHGQMDRGSDMDTDTWTGTRMGWTGTHTHLTRSIRLCKKLPGICRTD